MRLVFLLLIQNIPCAVCVGWAGVLAYQGRPGWGWFLFVGALLIHSVKSEGK